MWVRVTFRELGLEVGLELMVNDFGLGLVVGSRVKV